MMTILIVLRHAKAAKSHPEGDHARPLSDAGRAAAVRAGERLADYITVDTAVFASDATRTRETAELAFSRSGQQVQLDSSLYAAGTDHLLSVVRAFPSTVSTAVLVGHNPGVSDLAKLLAGHGAAADLAAVARGLSTADAAVIEFPIGWSAIVPGSGTLLAMVARQDEQGS